LMEALQFLATKFYGTEAKVLLSLK
jgi:hypothetical protein